MKLNRSLNVLVFCSVLGIPTISCQKRQYTSLPDNFTGEVFKHIEYLSSKIGIRPAGTDKEKDAAGYICNQFKLAGAKSVIEPIAFESAEIEKTVLLVGDRPYNVKSIGFNPYKGITEFSGKALLYDSNQPSAQGNSGDITGKAVISANPSNFFTIMRMNPALILYVDTVSCNRIKSAGDFKFNLKMDVRLRRYESSNIVGMIGDSSDQAKEIIISAHYDSYRTSPGADDNATGAGVLIELVKYFKSIGIPGGIRIKFIAFGAEELGLVGSRGYLLKHSGSLDHCELMINLDQVGGMSDCSVDMNGGVHGLPLRKGMNQFPEIISGRALEDLYGRWKLLEPSLISCFSISDHPQWLVDLIQKVVKNLGVRIIPSNNLGSDQMTFSQAGIVSTGIGISGNPFHSPADTLGNVYPPSIKKAGEFTAGLALETIWKLTGNKISN
ncbi:MAG TPA: M28 family peptidase [Bacteroidales bacterium]|nr:M28 family peptidase [Bacteroidales bacterium]